MTSLPIPLTEGFSPIVQVGDSITVGQVIAQKKVKQEEIIDIAKELRIPVKKVAKFLQKNPGDTIRVGDVLAKRKSGIFGMNEDVLESQVYGIITKFERDNGTLIIKLLHESVDKNPQDVTDEAVATEKTIDLISPIEGKISLCNNEKIEIETDKNCLSGINGIGDNIQGYLSVLDTSSGTQKREDAVLYTLDAKIIGKIILGKQLRRDALIKSIGIGAVGIISTDILSDDLSYITEKKMTIPIITINEEDYKRLYEWNNKEVFMNPQTKSIVFLQNL